MNKKAIMGLVWLFAALAVIIAFGYFWGAAFSTKIPVLGQYSVDVTKALEEGTNIPLTMEIIMKQLNKEAAMSYKQHQVFDLDSYCRDINDGDSDGNTEEPSAYKQSLIDKNIEFKPPLWLSKRENVKCYVNEEELMKYYSEVFDYEYGQFKVQKHDGQNLDFSNTNYKSTLVKAGSEYYNEIRTNNGLKIPINTIEDQKEKQIGTFTIGPNFKILVENPAGKPFDKTEICIFAKACGATCHDVIERYPGQNYKIIGNAAGFGCDSYYSCTTPKDDFGEEYLCDIGKILCQGSCLPFCSADTGLGVPIPATSNLVTDSDASTTCAEYQCNSYLSCSSTSTCGCSPAANACTGTDCQTLHCDRDSQFESKTGTKTTCKNQCSKYGDCLQTSSCACDSGLEACQGSCYCNPKPTYTGSCGGESCSSSARPIYRDYDPPACHASEFLGCTACDASCDPCSCSYGPKCGACGWDECPPPPPPPPPPTTPPPPPSTPAGDSCQGRCGSQAPSGCWCDHQSESSQGCEFYGDCCSDFSQYC